MTEASPLLGLPYIQPAQAQKHVTHNEAIRRLDLLTQIAVRSATLTAPPSDLVDGDRFILPVGAPEPWAAAGHIACRDGAAWTILAPNTGWLVWIADEARLVVWTGSAWAATGGGFDMLGVNATADATNRLAISAPASLFNHEGQGHQIKLNKATAFDTGAVLFQTNWSGRAELGLAGSDDFAIKVSADGNSFAEALRVDRMTGRVAFPQGIDGLAMSELFANGTCATGDGQNYPAGLSYDAAQAPDLPAAMAHAGYGGVTLESAAFMPIDPHQTYRLSIALRQESVAGDWSGFAQAERQGQTVGLRAYDAAGNLIEARHHMRHHHAGTDSLTVLAAPLAPGDTAVTVANAAGWNESSTADYDRGIIMLAYKDARGRAYDRYSRIVSYGLFDLGDVNKTTGVITLNQPWPANLGNPDDAGGVWPAGTPLANSASGESHKTALCQTLVPAAADQWYRLTNWIGGTDRSGTNAPANFAPGTASVRVIWRPNETNVPGGASGFADTGAGQRVWFAGASLMLEPHAAQISGAGGAPVVKVLSLDAGTGSVTLANAALRIEEI